MNKGAGSRFVTMGFVAVLAAAAFALASCSGDGKPAASTGSSSKATERYTYFEQLPASSRPR